ncbi:hypothetical protein DP68_14710 [Clostridium sp. HMP27]|nr:hypothetical protein DP68_14710 [Clostridium sp. HMP27]
MVLAKRLAKTNDVFYICKIYQKLTDKYKLESFNVIAINYNNEKISKLNNRELTINKQKNVNKNRIEKLAIKILR